MVSAAWLTFASVATANDSTFGGAGADLVPLTQSNVAMQSEDIVLTYRGGDWQVQARYVFFNHAAEPLTLQVGFPEYRCEPDPNNDCRNVAFRGLSTQVDGKPVKHRSGKLGKGHAWASYLGTVWLFDATFPAQRELVIEHSYSLSSGGDAMSNQFTTYVTRTGASWKGNIGRARFTARLPASTHTVRQLLVAGAQVATPRLLLDSEPEPRVELSIEAKDWTPQGEVHVAFNNAVDAAGARLPSARAAWKKGKLSYDELFPRSECWQVLELAPGAVQDCKNLVYASKGYGFKSRALSERFYADSSEFQLVKTELGDYWVRGLSALPRFSVEDFGTGERYLLAQLESAGQAEPAASAEPFVFSPPSESTAAPAASLHAEPPRARPLEQPTRKACGCRAVGTGSTGHEATALLLLAFLGVRRGRRSGAS